MRKLVTIIGRGVFYIGIIAILIFSVQTNQYQVASIFLVMMACVPVFIIHEKKSINTKELALIAVLTATAVLSRLIFYFLPALTPMTAIIIITGSCLGAEKGFLVGNLAAITSNILFGQGPWTPFQMFAWGVIGFFAGLPWLKDKLRQHYWLLALYGFFAGIFFSCFMDLWTVFSIDRSFSLERYMTFILAALPYTLTYCFSNMFFSCLLVRGIEKKLSRITMKYDL